MKYFVFILVTLCSQISFSQDLITFRDGSVKSVNVKEISETEVKYQKTENSSVIYSVLKTSLFSIQFKNGEKEVFSQAVAPQNINPQLQQMVVAKQPKTKKSDVSAQVKVSEPFVSKNATLTLKDGSTKTVMVKDITQTEVKYQKNNNTQITYSIAIADLNSLLYIEDNEPFVFSNTVIEKKQPETIKTLQEKPQNVIINSNNIEYKGFIEVGYGLSLSNYKYSYGISLQPAEIGIFNTSHGVIISNMFFIGVGGAYLKTLKTGGADGFGIHGDIRLKVFNVGNTNFMIGGKGGVLFSDKYSGTSEANATLKGGLMLNPFISGEIKVSESNNLVITAGYRSQRYVIDANVYNSGLNRTITTKVFNDDAEYLNFTVGISF